MICRKQSLWKIEFKSKCNFKILKGITQPSIDTLKSLADIFEVTVDYLIGMSDIKNPYGKSQITPSEADLIEHFLHELGTAARRTLGHNLFFDIYKLSTRIGNGGSPCTRAKYVVTFLKLSARTKINRPRQCMRCRGRFGFTRGFLKLSY